MQAELRELTPPVSAYNSAIGACAKGAQAKYAYKLLRRIESAPAPPPPTSMEDSDDDGDEHDEDAAVDKDGLGQGGSVSDAEFQQLLAALGAMTKNGGSGDAGFIQLTLEPNAGSYTATIAACAAAATAAHSARARGDDAAAKEFALGADETPLDELVLELLREMQTRGLRAPAGAYSKCIETLARTRSAQLPPALVAEARAQRLSPNGLRTLALVDEARERGLVLNSYAYNAALGAASRGGQWARVGALFDEMRTHRHLRPNRAARAAAIEACGKDDKDRDGASAASRRKAARVQCARALKLLAEASDAGEAAEGEYIGALGACARAADAGAALALLDEVRGHRQAAPCAHSATTQSTRTLPPLLLGEMERVGVARTPRALARTALACGAARRPEAARELLHEASPRHGVAPDRGVYSAVVRALAVVRESEWCVSDLMRERDDRS